MPSIPIASALNYLGYMLADRNERHIGGAHDDSKAVDMDPHNAAYLDSLGWVYYRLNRRKRPKSICGGRSNEGAGIQRCTIIWVTCCSARDNLKDAITQWEIAVREWQSSAPSDMDRRKSPISN